MAPYVPILDDPFTDEYDRQSLNSGGVQVQYCDQYLYLGAWFTDTAHTNNATALHHIASEAIANKFDILCASNTLTKNIKRKEKYSFLNFSQVSLHPLGTKLHLRLRTPVLRELLEKKLQVPQS
ncbi:hypothetical protein E2C01_047661 [Portunus trituberculatus]|uniref:Uncharacterized protein n=1 Tax=Portunus trituberculatus TaxID=210409 RepID=A0A5B7G955_PORTR|nr:hypothetical protein [Portunus trituberculatus]